MSKPLLSRSLLLFLALLFASTALAQSRRGYVRLTRIGPTVLVEDNTGAKERMTVVEETRILENNTVITTGPDSRVILVFSNGATLSVKEDSQVNIVEFRQDPFAGDYDMKAATTEPDARSRTEIFLKEGEIIGNVKTLRPGSEFNVKTPVGAAGIRGTTFRVVFRPSGTGQAFFSVTTLEGDVGVTTTEGTVDAPISVVDNEEVVIVVEVDDVTGEVTVVTPIEQIAPTAADPVVLSTMASAVQQSAEAVINIVLNANTDQDANPVTDGGGTADDTTAGDADETTEDTTSTGDDDSAPGGGTEGGGNQDGGETPPPPPDPVAPPVNNASDPTPGAGQS